VSELVKVTNRKYNLAMAVVLQRDLDSVVVRDKAAAFACVDFLKANKCVGCVVCACVSKKGHLWSCARGWRTVYRRLTLTPHSLSLPLTLHHSCATHSLLTQTRLERMDFIPLDSCDAKPLPQRLRQLGGTATPAIDLLSFDQQYERAVVHVTGCVSARRAAVACAGARPVVSLACAPCP
jgi:hypothetical protein